MTMTKLPIFKAYSFVGYPGLSLNLVCGGERFVEAIDQTRKQKSEIAILTRSLDDRGDIYPYGVTARIEKGIKLPDGMYKMYLTCGDIFKFNRVIIEDELEVAEGERVKAAKSSKTVDEDVRLNLAQLLSQWQTKPRPGSQEAKNVRKTAQLDHLLVDIMDVIYSPPVGRDYGYELLKKAKFTDEEKEQFKQRISARVSLLSEPNLETRLQLVE